MSEEFQRLHPILHEIANTFTQLYEHPDEVAVREQLLKVEHLLEVKLAEVRTLREMNEQSG